MTQTDALKPRSLRNPLAIVILYLAERYGGKRAKEVERFLKFAVVGTVGAILDLGLVFLLQATVLPPKNDALVALASGTAFFTAVVNNFLWTRLWVYPDSRSRSIRKQLVQFTIISLIGGVARTSWVTWAHLPLGQALLPLFLPGIQLFRPGYLPSAHAAAKLGTLLAQLIGMAVVMLWNFFANRYWTYNDVE